MRKVLLSMAALALVAAFGRPALAGGNPWGVELQGAFNTYSMGDVNGLLDTGNFTHINSGLGGGLSVIYSLLDNVRLNVQLDYLTASSSNSTGGGTFNLNLPDLQVGVGAAYLVPVNGMVDVKLGGVLSFNDLMGNSTGGGADSTFTGTGVGVEVTVGGILNIIPNVGLGLDLGYRYATIPTVTQTSNGSSSTLQNTSGKNASVDYSGLVARIGVSYWFSM